MGKIIRFGEDVEGYAGPVLNEREIQLQTLSFRVLHIEPGSQGDPGRWSGENRLLRKAL